MYSFHVVYEHGYEDTKAPYYVMEDGGFLVLLSGDSELASITGIINLNNVLRVDIEKIDGVH